MLSVWKPMTFSKLFGDFFNEFESPPSSFKLGLEQKRLEDGTFITTVDLPGVAESDISVEVKERYVTISGHKRTQTSSYSVSRTFNLPGDCDPDQLKAELKDGVLTLSTPGQPKDPSPIKKIPIKSV